jgi:hypothetical protein
MAKVTVDEPVIRQLKEHHQEPAPFLAELARERRNWTRSESWISRRSMTGSSIW